MKVTTVPCRSSWWKT